MWFSVGKTRSKKVVYFTKREDLIEEMFGCQHTTFNDNDYFDAYAIYQYMISRCSLRGEANDLESFHSEFISGFIGSDILWAIAHQLNLPTVHHICWFGQTLSNVELKNPK